MKDDDYKKYYETDEANLDSKSDSRVILFLIVVAVIISGLPELQISVFEYHHTTMMTLGMLIQLLVLFFATIISLKVTPKKSCGQ